ncbi:MAG TPA: hydantoinase B/oxoprolinase family protein [Cycloclasticus sp.]|jgi:N-methylhydantoinase B|nr:hydantoinase B/oxoprolinase family protein [Cycloclasticus sp.]HIL91716.1 hydantoinase B/oxoprolinase family protein [Cycloclasticus sp.]
MDAIELSVFSSRIESVCDEMGAVLQRAAFSPNIKDRLDFSCAVFDTQGQLCAQAAHIPVHLGSMAYAMQDIVDQFDWQPGDMVAFNDPYLGGTHLPDVTLVCPVHADEKLIGFVANRAHHADIGSDTPGSMPLATNLEQEGIIISPVKIMREGKTSVEFDEIMRVLQNTIESTGDFNAQMSANQRGSQRLSSIVKEMDAQQYNAALVHLNAYGDRLMQQLLTSIPDGEYDFLDWMDGDGLGAENIPIKVNLAVQRGTVVADFKGTANQVSGNINCPLSVVAAVVYYVFRCLLPANTPACFGVYRRIDIKAPHGSLVNAIKPAAVAAGNVETSTRLVDVVMGALAKALPARITAASHGSMNNVAMGARTSEGSWNYYETIGGGMGAGAQYAGLSAVQTHMTNTLNTPIESLEMHYPLRVSRYQVRRGSGGTGKQQGGDGLLREMVFLQAAQLTLLTERRDYQPWGLNGGADAAAGENFLNGEKLQAKVSLAVDVGDRLTIKTPGGGGYGLDGE